MRVSSGKSERRAGSDRAAFSMHVPLLSLLLLSSISWRTEGLAAGPRPPLRGGKPVQQKGGKANAKNTVPPQPVEEPLAVAEGKSFAKTTIWGQNIINCRPFSLESPKKFSFLGSFTSSKTAPVYPSPEVAFIGRSNVGKSSLLNTLTGGNKKIAVESKTPGRTQCINMFKCEDREGDIAVLVDLPGYGYAKISKTQQEQISGFLQEYMKERSSLRLVFVLVDIRREPQDLDRAMIDFLEEEGVDYVVCATKVDKMASKSELATALTVLRKAYKLPAGQPIAFSSVTGEGRKEIWRNMRDGILGVSPNEEDGDEDDDMEGEEEDEAPEDNDPLAEIIESERKSIRILRKK